MEVAAGVSKYGCLLRYVRDHAYHLNHLEFPGRVRANPSGSLGRLYHACYPLAALQRPSISLQVKSRICDSRYRKTLGRTRTLAIHARRTWRTVSPSDLGERVCIEIACGRIRSTAISANDLRQDNLSMRHRALWKLQMGIARLPPEYTATWYLCTKDT